MSWPVARCRPASRPWQWRGELYWDGGCVSNTPLEAVLLDQPAGHTIVFMIDLWAAQGAVPRTMDEVLWRQKQIQYASRTAQHIDAVATKLTSDARSASNRPHPTPPEWWIRRYPARWPCGMRGWTSSTSPISRRRIRFRRAMPSSRGAPSQPVGMPDT